MEVVHGVYYDDLSIGLIGPAGIVVQLGLDLDRLVVAYNRSEEGDFRGEIL